VTDIDKAVALFDEGCACSQAMLGAFGPGFGLDEARAVRLAAGFAGGMKMAETCGAVTGAFMVLGLAWGGPDCRTADGRKAAHDAVVAFTQAFRARHGSLTCRDLLGCDISTPDGLQAARDRNAFKTDCTSFVRDAATLLERHLPARTT
jgi:C_GCAxxG_C_C family probable redox protein